MLKYTTHLLSFLASVFISARKDLVFSNRPSLDRSATLYFSLLSPCRRYQKPIAQIMIASYLAMPGALLAQGVSAANTAHAPSFDTSANGVPIVNINAPSAAGVSRNEYNELNVEKKGLIFNNSTKIVSTQLAGYVDGNSHLKGKNANIILNEVLGNNKSSLNGFMEIAGKSAELVIANQNGISCNGCGFINTTRGTLTTGRSVFDAAGNLNGFDVSKGHIDIAGAGLNASNIDEVDLLARSVSLNGKLWANKLDIVTGSNHINYQDKTTSKLSSSTSEKQSGFSLDVAAIGGMYANRILLVGTDKGLGVNLNGDVSATQSMVLNTKGDLVNNNKLTAKTLSVTSAQTITNTGSVLGDNVSLNANALDNKTSAANIQATDTLGIQIQGDLNNTDGATVLSKNGQITLKANKLVNQSSLAAKRLNIQAGTLQNTTKNGALYGIDNLTLSVTGQTDNTDNALIHSDNELAIHSDGLTNSANIESVKSANMTTQHFTNTGTILAENGALTVNTNKIDNQGALAGNGIILNADQLNNGTTNGQIISTDKADFTIAGDVTNTDGALIHADKALTLNATGDLTNTDSIIESVNSVDANSQNLTNSGTVLAQNGALTIHTRKVDSQGILAGNGITLHADELNNSTANGKIVSTDKADFTIAGDVTNTDGALIHTAKALTLTSTAGNVVNSNATIESAAKVNINSQNLTNSGTVLAQGDGLTIDANTINNQGLLAGHGMNIQTGLLNNTTSASKLYSNKDLKVNTSGSINNTNGALIHADNVLTLTASGDVTNTNSSIESASNATLISHNLVNSSGSRVLAEKGALTINANTLNNQGVLSGQGLSATASVINNDASSSSISSTKDLTLKSTQGDVTNSNGAKIHSNGNLTINSAGDLSNTSGDIEAINDITLFANNITNASDSVLRSNDSILMKWSGDFLNSDSKIEALNNIVDSKIEVLNDAADSKKEVLNNVSDSKKSGNLKNTSTGIMIAQNGNLRFSVASLSNQGGITANKVKLKADDISNDGSNALIMAKSDLDVRSSRDFNNTNGGAFYSLGTGDLEAIGTLTNSSSTIETNGDLVIHASHIINKKRDFSASRRVTKKVYTGVPIAVPSGYESATRNYTETITTPYIKTNSPQSYILSAGSLSMSGAVDNIYSIISAGKNIDFDSTVFNNVSYSDKEIKVSSGIDYLNYRERYCKHHIGHHCRSHGHRTRTNTRGYDNTTEKVIVLAAATFSANNTISGKGKTFNNVGKADSFSNSDLKKEEIKPLANDEHKLTQDTSNSDKTVSGSAYNTTSTDAVTLKSRRDKVFSDNSVSALESSALFQSNDAPNPSYLVETNPLLTHYKNFVSSDYFLNKVTADSVGRTGKNVTRLGDGYLEQKLVRDQILTFTGQQTLPNNRDIESTYVALMNNAANSYKKLGLTLGVELTASQVSKLKEPIVWMVYETVQTKNGPQDVLVPKVYFSVASGFDLRPDGAVVAASTINIETHGDINNTGGMLAKNDLTLKGNNINNAGIMSAGNNTNLAASADILNTGTVKAVNVLNLKAGGNIINKTNATILEHKRGNYSASETLVGDTATLQGANVNLSAGKDIQSVGGNISASKEVSLDAGDDISLSSLAVTNSSKDGSNFSHSDTKQNVTTLSGNNIRLNAGNTITSEGAQVNAKGDLALDAQNIDLQAVKNTNDDYSFVGGGHHSIETKDHTELLTGTTLKAGGGLSLTAQQDILSKGSTLNGGSGIALAAGNNVTLATESTHDSHFKKEKTKKSGFFGSKTKTETTSSESLTNHGTNLASDGDIQIKSGADIQLIGSTANATGNVDLQAKGNIDLLSAVDQTTHRQQEQKKGAFKQSAKDKGFNSQTAVASGLTSQGNIGLNSGSNITLQGTNIDAKDTLSMGAQAVSKDASGHYVTGDGAKVGNVNITSQALKSDSWDKSSSGYRGIAKYLATGIVVAAGNMGVHASANIGHADETRTQVTTQQASNLSSGSLDIKADHDLNIIGSNVSATGDANLSAAQVRIDAAKEQYVSSESHTKTSVSSQAPRLQKDQISLMSITDTDKTHKTTTTSDSWSGSNISVGNLTVKAKDQASIIASSVDVTGNADIQANNVLVGGREASTTTQQDDITKAKKLTVGVSNAYVDTALAVQDLKKSKEAVSAAQHDYDAAKKRVQQGQGVKQDLDIYQHQLENAKKKEKYAAMSVANAGVSAATSTATLGFTMNTGLSSSTTTDSRSSTQTDWQGSNINIGKNAAINSQNNLSVKGSSIAASGTMDLNGKNIDISAGKDTYAETSEHTSKGYGISKRSDMPSRSVRVNGSSGHDSNQITQYDNSNVSAGTVRSNSDTLSLKGANLYGDHVAINTGKLDVVSLQDTANTRSNSKGRGLTAGSASESLNYNRTNVQSDFQSVGEQSSILSGDKGYQIKVTGNTNLVGGLIASTDTAESNKKNAFSTASLTSQDVQNSSSYSGSSFRAEISKGNNKKGVGNNALSKSWGYGSDQFSQTSTTQSGINTDNIAINDAGSQARLTGKSVAQTIAGVKTNTSTDTAEANSGTLVNAFDETSVKQQINNQSAVAQSFSKSVLKVGTIINGKLDALNKKLKSGQISRKDYEDQSRLLNASRLLVNSIGAGLLAPTDSVAGSWAAAASPTVAYGIGQYFKNLASSHQDGELTSGEEIAHDLAHGIVAAAVASAGGNNIATAGISAAASEAAAPAVAKWLYGTSDPKELNADQKQTIASIFGAASFALGSAAGSTTNGIASSQLGENAVANNYLTLKQKETFSRTMRTCKSDGKQDCSGISSKWSNINSKQSQNLNGKDAWDLQYSYKDKAEDAIDGSIFTNLLGDDETNQLVDQWNESDIDKMDQASPFYDRIGAYALNHPQDALATVFGGGPVAGGVKSGLTYGLRSGLKYLSRSAGRLFSSRASKASSVAEDAASGIINKEGSNVTKSADDFFDGTKYTNKVKGQMKQDDFHSFPESVKGFQDAGKVTKIKGGDGVVRDKLEIRGNYRARDGNFEFIKEPDNTINHRLFRPNKE